MKDFDSNSENVFRKKITSHEFKFDSSSWDKMEKMLDDEDPRQGVAWRYPYMMIILGIFFVGITLLNPPIDSDTSIEKTDQVIVLPTNTTTNSVLKIEPTTSISRSTISNKTLSASVVENSLSTQATAVEKARIEKSIINNTTSNAGPIQLNTTPVEAVKKYIETIPDAPVERENIQAFIEINSLLAPVKYEAPIASALPLELDPMVLEKKRVKMGVQVGASVVLAKKSIADQGKLATAIGGFINFEIDAKNTITIEANYKNGYSERPIIAANYSADQEVNPPNNQLQMRGYMEANNIERLHSIEIPVIYKRKLGRKNNIIAGVKPSLIKFKSITELETSMVGLGETRLDANKMIEDVAFVGGLEHQFSKNLSVDVRYNQGLLNISDVQNVRNTNSELSMTMKYTF